VHAPLPSAEPGGEAELVLTVVGGETPAAADALVRTIGDTAYVRIAAKERNGVFRASVPASFLTPPGFEYFLLVRMTGGEEITSPPGGADRRPYRVPVSSPDAVARIVVLSPERDAVVGESADLSIAVLFDPPLLPGDSAGLFLDGKEIVEGIERTADYLRYEPSAPLSRGSHEAAAFLASASGARGERRWRFFVGEAERGVRGPRLSGRAEAGWAFVRNGGVEGDPVLSYDETSSLAYDAYASGEWMGRSVSFSSSRDPIYDDEIRGAARLVSDALTIEVGDVYPSFSDLSVSWLSGKGVEASVRRGSLENLSFFVRSLPSDTTEGLGIYSQFVSGEKLTLIRDRWDLAVHAVYGWERESSVPESLRILPPLENLVLAATGGIRLGGGRRLVVETGWSDTKGDDTTSAGAFRAALSLLDSPGRSVSLEYHDFRPGYEALASPTVDGGERGVAADGSFRVGGIIRQSLRMEFYEDEESVQEMREGGWIVQVYGRTDLEWKRAGVSWNPYLLFRAHEIPYASAEYANRYGTVGVYARGTARTLSLSATRTDTRSSNRTRGWAANASLSGGGSPDARFWWKLGERFGASKAEGDALDAGPDSVLSDERRWTLDAEVGIRAAGLEWRLDYQRIDESDAAEDNRFTQHLFLMAAGRRF
jgi:hypothetical protein